MSYRALSKEKAPSNNWKGLLGATTLAQMINSLPELIKREHTQDGRVQILGQIKWFLDFLPLSIFPRGTMNLHLACESERINFFTVRACI